MAEPAMAVIAFALQVMKATGARPIAVINLWVTIMVPTAAV